MEVGNESGITQEPVRKSGRFDGRIVPGIFIGDCIVIHEDANLLVSEGGGEHMGGRAVSSVDAGSGIVSATRFFISHYDTLKLVSVITANRKRRLGRFRSATCAQTGPFRISPICAQARSMLAVMRLSPTVEHSYVIL